MKDYLAILEEKIHSRCEFQTEEALIDAVRFSTSKVILGDEADAIAFLNDVVVLDSSQLDSDLWAWNSLGVSLLAELSLELDKKEQCHAALKEFDWLPSDRVAYAATVVDNHKGIKLMIENTDLSEQGERFSVCDELIDELAELRYYHEYFFHMETPSFLTSFRLRNLASAKKYVESYLESLLLPIT